MDTTGYIATISRKALRIFQTHFPIIALLLLLTITIDSDRALAPLSDRNKPSHTPFNAAPTTERSLYFILQKEREAG
jgi:hypothetical protein